MDVSFFSTCKLFSVGLFTSEVLCVLWERRVSPNPLSVVLLHLGCCNCSHCSVSRLCLRRKCFTFGHPCSSRSRRSTVGLYLSPAVLLVPKHRSFGPRYYCMLRLNGLSRFSDTPSLTVSCLFLPSQSWITSDETMTVRRAVYSSQSDLHFLPPSSSPLRPSEV